MSSRPPHYSARYRFDLSPRQCEVLELVARGRTNGEIAEALGITLDGVKWHIREILTKLEVGSREEAAAVWRERKGAASQLRRMLFGPAIPAAVARVLAIGALAAGVVALGTVLVIRGDSGGPQTDAPPASGAGAVAEATPAGVLVPPCDAADFTVSVRAEPWFGDNLITVESVNNGGECGHVSGVGIQLLPSPPGTSWIGLPLSPPIRSGEQPAVQVIWRGGCAAVGRLFDIQVRYEYADATLRDVPARGCVPGEGDALFPAEKVRGGLPSCRTSQLALGSVLVPTAQRLEFAVRVVNNAAPCLLRGNLSMELLDRSGFVVVGALGNPVDVSVEADLDGQLMTRALAWENWCGSPGTFTVRLALGALSVSSVVESPACTRPGERSQLVTTPAAVALAPNR
ncbi:MAG: helix-turn-helix transcriptional regulator [Chloroflexi bacterium]|nr:helix-turn-helix transcriptional regulator [Chloroflexota bacterium]